ncbi:ATP-binding protein [Streptomyces eurythermus]|uniref:ATP-binding protein n=1 Tax=Streptomyces eurythermus TaxID=42237 RepID=UPI003F4D406E
MPSVRDGAIVAGVIPSAPLGTDAAAGRTGLGAEGGIPARAGSGLMEGAPLQGGAAGRRFRFELAAHPGSVAQARRLTQARLSGWAVCADTCDSAALVISELVTNAIVHTASSRVVCELHDHDDMVRIAVRDEGCAPGEPHPSPQRPDEEHGRGLLLVDALCRAWGAQEHGPGLLVWAELPRGTDSAQEAGTAQGAPEPRADLGWGARPKPGRTEDSGEDQQSAAERYLRESGRYDGDALHAERHPHTASAEQPAERPCRTPEQRRHREWP